MRDPSPDLTLQLDERLYTTLVNSIRGIVWEGDPLSFRFTYVSPQAEQIMGYPSRQWIEEPGFWINHLHPDDAAWCPDFCKNAVKKGEDHEFDYRMIAADGKVVWLHDIVTVSADAEGKVRVRGIMFDITDAKLAEMKLRQSEERFSLAMQGANDGLYDWNLLTDEVYYSPRWKSMLGYAEEELPNTLETWTVLVHPEEREAAQAVARGCREGLIERFEREFRLKHKEGHYITVLSRAFLSRSREGTPLRLVGTHVDVTEQKRLLETLQLREHYQRAILDNFPCATWLKDTEGRFLSVNRQLAVSFGRTPEELVGKSPFDLFSPDLAEMMTAEDRKVLESGRPKRAEEFLPASARGDNRWFEVYQSPITIGESCIGTVGCIWDITERKNVEQALAESEARYRRLVEVSPDALFIHQEGQFVFLNVTAARLLGAERPEDLYGRRALDFVHPDYHEMVARRIEHAWARGDNPPVEELLVRLDGSLVPVEMVSVHFIYQGRDAVFAVARDISERKRMQEELLRAQKLDSLGVLAGGIAHDFNNILTGILGNLSLVRMFIDPPEKVATVLGRCEMAALRARELTQQLLTFARGGDPIRKMLEAAPLVKESVCFVLRGSNVKAKVSLPDDLWCFEADAGQINQVLNNILINAVQAMPAGGMISISSANEVVGPSNTKLPAGHYLKIVIEDQGHGIPPEHLPKIFDPFFTTKQRGNGLGLASVYSIVKRHGGTVEVSSTVGVGSRFTLHLPAVPGREADGSRAPEEEVMAGKGRILVMDDEELIRDLAVDILTLAGYAVQTCADGRDAVARYRSALRQDAPFDAVVMDLTVPGGMGGKEAAQAILRLHPEAVLIVSSGYSNDPVMAAFQQYGFSGAVAKPFSAGALTAEVQRLLR